MNNQNMNDYHATVTPNNTKKHKVKHWCVEGNLPSDGDEKSFKYFQSETSACNREAMNYFIHELNYNGVAEFTSGGVSITYYQEDGVVKQKTIFTEEWPKDQFNKIMEPVIDCNKEHE